MMIPDYKVSSFSGLNTFIRDKKTFSKGVAKDSLNWITGKFGDHIALRPGMLRLGSHVSGAGHISGIGVARRADKTEVLYWSHGRKVKYYDADAEDWVEIGSSILPATADGEDVWFAAYHNLMGAMMLFGSKNSSVYKSMTAHPGDVIDQATNNFRFGVFVLGVGRSLAGQRNGTVSRNKDDTGMYLSSLDKALLTGFTLVTGEAIGSLGSTTYTGTLAERTGIRTVGRVTITETDGEILVDDLSGNLIGNLGSTGTINYATGAYSITFNHTTTGNVTASYYWEDLTDDSILDFDLSSPGTGEAKLYRQDTAGLLMAIVPFLNVHYALHELLTWAVTIALDDVESTNLPYRKIGITNPRAAALTPDGVLVVDVANPADPKFRRLEVAQNSDNLTVVPTPLSDALNLSIHAFDKAVTKRWSEWDMFACQEYVNGAKNDYNSAFFIRNVVSGAIDKLDYPVSCLEEYMGMLVGGHSFTKDVFVLFSGYDDDGSPITNHWNDGYMDLGTPNLKRCNRMKVSGLIQRSQRIRVSISVDEGNYTEVFIIDGDDSRYVNHGINVMIGANSTGSTVIGGGGQDSAHPFEVEFKIHTDRFETASTQFEALEIGYAQINEYTYRDIRDKGRRSRSVITILEDEE